MFTQKDDLIVENIFKKIDDYAIFKNYCTNFNKVGEYFKSELRKDTNPSCVINYYNGRLWYRDFGDSESLDCFSYIMKKYNMTFMEALGTVNLDFNLGLRQEIIVPSLNYIGLPDIRSRVNPINRREKSIRVKAVSWNVNNIRYWEEYGITKKILKYYNVEPIIWYTINNIRIQAEEFTYSYFLGTHNGMYIYKIYAPFSESKWISNAKADIYSGYSQLPLYGKLLIITKSLKDVMVLAQLKIPSIAPQSESNIIKEEFMALLKRRFESVIMFYDNDKTGRINSTKACDKFNLKEIYIPITLLEKGIKDISDYSKEYGLTEAKQFLTRELNNI